jgi:uncharacterized protein with GYD domain
MIQVSYSTGAWAALVKRPENRIEVVRKVVEKLGGTIVGFWFAFGEHDIVGILEMPDNVTAAAFAVAIAAGGACKSVKTTPLISTEDAMSAMKKAGRSGYKPIKGAK